VPTGLGRLSVEVQRCPLDSRGPWLRSSSALCDQELARRRGGEEERKKEARRAILKSSNPHLAGGGKKRI